MGSKGLPKKNKKLFKGKPLIVHTIEAAMRAQHIDRVIVSTDDREIAGLSANCGAEIPFLRSAYLASDTATTSKVVAHLLNYLKAIHQLPEHYILLQPTCPLRTSKHIDEAASLYFNNRYASVMSVCEVKEHPYTMKKIVGHELHDFIAQKDKPTNRQQYPQVVRLNGAIYIGQSRLFLKHESFHLEPCGPYVMSMEDSIDIDTEEDFIAAQHAYDRKGEDDE